MPVTPKPAPLTRPHILKFAVSSPKFSGPHYVCSCGSAAYYTPHIDTARRHHKRHVETMRAYAVLARYPSMAGGVARIDMGSVFDWAERDASECLNLATSDAEAREARDNLRLISRLRRVAAALLTIHMGGE